MAAQKMSMSSLPDHIGRRSHCGSQRRAAAAAAATCGAPRHRLTPTHPPQQHYGHPSHPLPVATAPRSSSSSAAAAGASTSSSTSSCSKLPRVPITLTQFLASDPRVMPSMQVGVG